MTLPPTKLAELNQIIHNQLNQANIRDHIKNALSSAMSAPERSESQPVTEQEILDDLKRKGIVQSILGKLKFETPIYNDQNKPATHKEVDEEIIKAKLTEKAAVDPTRRYLYFQVLGGKAFLEHLNAPAYSEHVSEICSTFQLNVHFRSQRFRSKLVPVACEPDFCEGFLLELHRQSSGEGASMADTQKLLSISDPIEVVLTKHDADGTVTLVSSHSIEWRNVLTACNSYVASSIELMGVGTECKVPAGIIDIRLELIPSHKLFSLTSEVVEAQTHLEKQRRAERDRLFLVYGKQWWKEYLEIRDVHSRRCVKIFAQDENGVNRPVCSYVQPLLAKRLLTTPRMAARYVSLLSYETASAIGSGTKLEQWQSLLAFLCAKKGDHEDHSNLLCSLLLGFGLQAFVCLGTRSGGARYSWVMTRYCDGTVKFWDPITGIRYPHQLVDPYDPPIVSQPITKHPFKAVDCIYNHESFYANSQELSNVETTRFDLESRSIWKQMNSDAIKSVCKIDQLNSCRQFPPLAAPTLDPILISHTVEKELQSLIIRYREDLELSTTWDQHLSDLLTTSLASYELERLCGVANVGNEDFQDIVRRAVPDGSTFKGFPIQVLHRNAVRAFRTSMKNQVCADIVECRGDNVRHAVHVSVSVFPDDVVAMWIMFACRYCSVQ